MKKLFSNQNICEVFLSLYFSEQKERCLGKTLIAALDDFIEFYRAEDKFNNTRNVEAIEKIYCNREFDTRSDFLKYISFSETALFRFRTKLSERLMLHLQTCLFETPDSQFTQESKTVRC